MNTKFVLISIKYIHQYGTKLQVTGKKELTH